MKVTFFGMMLAAFTPSPPPASDVTIENVVARVMVIPEARSDIDVQVSGETGRLPPLSVVRRGSMVEIDGDLESRIAGCNRDLSAGRGHLTPSNVPEDLTVTVRGIGAVRLVDAPVIIIRTPMDVAVQAGGATFGSIGDADRLGLRNHGCGDWTIADVRGQLAISEVGPGNVVAGSAHGLYVRMIGSGDVRVARVTGPVRIGISGSGDVIVESGRADALQASVTGSGNVDFRGHARSLDASATGSGEIRVAEVEGPVSRSLGGSGRILVGE